MFENAPVIPCRNLGMARFVYDVAPMRAAALPFLDLRPYLSKPGAMLDVPAGDFNLSLPSSWMCEPPHLLFLQGGKYLGDEFEILGAALQRSTADGDGYVVDVGGNIGFHALRMRSFTKLPIISFEPNPFVFEILRNNLARNAAKLPNIEAVMLACSDAPGTVSLRSGGLNSVIEPPASESREWEKCKTLPLDELMHAMNVGRVMADVECVRLDDYMGDRKVRFIKVDVEGFEHRVLHGAESILRRDRPVLFLELHPRMLPLNGSSLESVIEYLHVLGCKTTFHQFVHATPTGKIAHILHNMFPPPSPPYETLAEAMKNSPPGVEQLHVVAVPQ